MTDSIPRIFKKYMDLFDLKKETEADMTETLGLLRENDKQVTDITQKLEFSVVINDFPVPSFRFGYFKANSKAVKNAVSKYAPKTQLDAAMSILKPKSREFAMGLDHENDGSKRVKLYSLKLEDMSADEINENVIVPLNKELRGTDERHVPKYGISIVAVEWKNDKPSLKVYERSKEVMIKSLRDHIGTPLPELMIDRKYLDDCWLLTRYGETTSKSVFFSFKQAPKPEIHEMIKDRFPDKHAYFNDFIKNVERIGELDYTFFGINDNEKCTIYFSIR